MNGPVCPQVGDVAVEDALTRPALSVPTPKTTEETL